MDVTEQKVSTASLENSLGGYHRCFLDVPGHLEFVSENLSTMLGYKKSELDHLIGHVYTAIVHPDDVHIFDEFVCRLSEKEGCESVTYRLIKKDGSVTRVADTMTSIRGNDSHMRGYSVVCEIPDHKVTSGEDLIGDKFAILRISGGDDALIELTSGMASTLLAIDGREQGLSLMDFVSISDRKKIREALHYSYENEYSGAISCAIVSTIGVGVQCDLWIERNDCGDGFDDCVFCVKIEIGLEDKRGDDAIAPYDKALFSSFAEEVFEADRDENTIKHICHGGSLGTLLNVRMNACDFLDWFIGNVAPEYRETVRSFCLEAQSQEAKWSRELLGPSKIVFEVLEECDFGPRVSLVMVPVSRAKYFLCLNPEAVSLGSGFCAATVAGREKVEARLFGHFGLAVDGRAVHIRCEKGRELLALLIERRGAFLTSREAIAMLWECDADDTTRARYRKVASRLMSELRKNGIDFIVESDGGARRIIPEFIDCDYYDYRDGLIESPDALLPEYTWSEFIKLD